jgi:hypothetical protein
MKIGLEIPPHLPSLYNGKWVWKYNPIYDLFIKANGSGNTTPFESSALTNLYTLSVYPQKLLNPLFLINLPQRNPLSVDTILINIIIYP